MFTLIKREIEYHAVHFLLALALSATGTGLLAYTSYAGLDDTVGIYVFLLLFILGACCGMGISQVYADRSNKTSLFLATLATTRGRILAARVIAGVLAILLVVTPIVVMAVVLLCRYLLPMHFYGWIVVEGAVTLFLVALGCYCFGLLIGSTARKSLLVAGCLLSPCIVLALVVAKGFGYQGIVILLLLIGVSLIRVTTKFLSTSL